MGKIKGWKNTKDIKGFVSWVYDDEDVYLSIKVYDVKKELRDKLKINKWVVEPFHDLEKSKSFKTKKEALAYASKYMRANQNG